MCIVFKNAEFVWSLIFGHACGLALRTTTSNTLVTLTICLALSTYSFGTQTALGSTFHYYVHLTDKETGTERLIACPRSHSVAELIFEYCQPRSIVQDLKTKYIGG
jgi:hypothetical protein